MNHRELQELRQRLQDRAAAETQDPPWLMAVVAFLFAFVFVTACFL
jgi:hypothetical protein